MGIYGMAPQDLHGSTLYSSDDQELGTVEEVLIDDEGSARFVNVRGGLFGMKSRTIPAAGIETNKDGLRSMYTAAKVAEGPAWDDDHLDYDRERELGGYYGQEVPDWSDEQHVDASREGSSEAPGAPVRLIRLRKWTELGPLGPVAVEEVRETTVRKDADGVVVDEARAVVEEDLVTGETHVEGEAVERRIERRGEGS